MECNSISLCLIQVQLRDIACGREVPAVLACAALKAMNTSVELSGCLMHFAARFATPREDESILCARRAGCLTLFRALVCSFVSRGPAARRRRRQRAGSRRHRRRRRRSRVCPVSRVRSLASLSAFVCASVSFASPAGLLRLSVRAFRKTKKCARGAVRNRAVVRREALAAEPEAEVEAEPEAEANAQAERQRQRRGVGAADSTHTASPPPLPARARKREPPRRRRRTRREASERQSL